MNTTTQPSSIRAGYDCMLSRLVAAVSFHMEDGKTYTEARALALANSCAGPAIIARLDAHFSE